jgi:hypothetical protein
MKLALEIIKREIAQRELANKHNHLRKDICTKELQELNYVVNLLSIPIVMPCFEFSNKATKYTENGVMTLAVDTDGIALANDNLPHQAYTLEEGVNYTVKLYKA